MAALMARPASRHPAASSSAGLEANLPLARTVAIWIMFNCPVRLYIRATPTRMKVEAITPMTR